MTIHDNSAAAVGHCCACGKPARAFRELGRCEAAGAAEALASSTGRWSCAVTKAGYKGEATVLKVNDYVMICHLLSSKGDRAESCE